METSKLKVRAAKAQMKFDEGHSDHVQPGKCGETANTNKKMW